MRVTNYQNKPLSDFTEGESLYVRKSYSSGKYDVFFLCEFIKTERGFVVVKVIESDGPFWYGKMPTQLRVRANNCLLWGENPKDTTKPLMRKRFNWFKNTKECAE